MNDPNKKRGRKLQEELPPSRSRDVQRAFRARRAAHLANLESRNAWLEEELAALRTRLGMGEEQYLTTPPPKEIQPDYEGVSEPDRVRGPNKRTTAKTKGVGSATAKKPAKENTEAVEGSSKDLEWLQDLGTRESETGALGLDTQGGGGGGQSGALDYSPFNMTPPLPTVLPQLARPSFDSFPPPGPQYGVYFVPKGSEQASFVGNTHYAPSSNYGIVGHENFGSSRSTSADASTSEGFPHSNFLPTQSLPPLTSPDALSSTSSIATNGLPTTPPDGWMTPRAVDLPDRRPREEPNQVFRAFRRGLSRAFGKGQTAAEDDTSPVNVSEGSSPLEPLPSIRLPRFSSGLPGSASSVSSPSTDTYLHVSKVFERFSPFLLSSPSPRLSPFDLIGMLQAQEQQSLLSNRPESFDFSRPPTCLFLPPFTSSSSQQAPRPAAGRKEMYVLAPAVEQVQRDLESSQLSPQYA